MTFSNFKNAGHTKSNEGMPDFTHLINELFDVKPVNYYRRSTVPAVNILETADNYKLEIAVPGLKKENFKINVEKDQLTVSSDFNEEKSEPNEKYTRKEFTYASFKRSFTLPEMVDSDKILATYENGVMTIELPKKEEAKPKAPREIKIS